MADPRLELLKQMRALRARIDPKIMDRVKWSYLGKVPINKDAAQSAVGHFLAERDDGGALRRRLEAAMAADGIAVDLDPREVPPDDEQPDFRAIHPVEDRVTGKADIPTTAFVRPASPEKPLQTDNRMASTGPHNPGYDRSGTPLKPRRIGRIA